MLNLISLNKKFIRKQTTVNALDEVSADIKPNQVTILMGPSGSGKSTLLRCLCRLEALNSGKILFNGTPLASLPANAISMVFQGFHLFPHLNVLDNITIGPKLNKLAPIKELEQKAKDLLERFGLADKAQAIPDLLSGGQKQRVAICRALIMEPQILLFDEPTSALDIEMTAEISKLIKSLVDKGRIIIATTHELSFAKATGDEILFMDQGKILEQQPAKNFFQKPFSERARQFISNTLGSL